MTSRPWTWLTALIGVICGYAFVKGFFFIHSRPVTTDVIQGVLCGVGFAFVTNYILAKVWGSRVNGWTTMYGCGEPGNGMFRRAASAHAFLGPVNVPQEAMYWTTSVDGAGHSLSGAHRYGLHFPAGGLPPNDAFWSLTMGDARNHFVANPIHRYSVSDRSGLVPNDDGSVDVYIQNAAPPGHETNWLPAPQGRFILWLRVYVPGAPVLDGSYRVPPVVEVK